MSVPPYNSENEGTSDAVVPHIDEGSGGGDGVGTVLSREWSPRQFYY